MTAFWTWASCSGMVALFAVIVILAARLHQLGAHEDEHEAPATAPVPIVRRSTYVAQPAPVRRQIERGDR